MPIIGGADYFLSIHLNAFNGSAHGYEDFIHDSLSSSSRTAQHRDIIHEEIIKVNNLFNRGKKKANFHVLRETKMPALLTENGFIDSTKDAEQIRDSAWRQRVAEGHVNGLEKAFSLTRKGRAIYRVYAGSFTKKEEAEKQVTLLKDKGFDSFIVQTEIDGKPFFRVQTGAFSNRENAENLVTRLDSHSIEAFIETKEEKKQDSNNDPDKQEDNNQGGEPIVGNSVLTGSEMNAYVQSIHPSAPKLGDMYVEESKKYGIRGDIAFAQAIHETGYFKFGGQVKKDQHNYAGIGATNDGRTAASFHTPREGVIAHLQHLYAYASTDALPEDATLVDPRFDLVTRGSATTWETLNGKWAVPGDRYGQMILEIYRKMQTFAKEDKQDEATDKASVIKQINNDIENVFQLLTKMKNNLNKLK